MIVNAREISNYILFSLKRKSTILSSFPEKFRKLHFPLHADFEPKVAIAKLYDVYDDEEGECKRALYVIDEDSIIRWNYLSPVGINPGADGILDALEEMNNNKK